MSETTYESVVKQIQDSLDTSKPRKIFTPNPEILLSQHSDSEYKKVIQSADLLLPDGIGVFIAYQVASFSGPRFLKYLLLPYWCLRAIFGEKRLHKKYGERIT